MQKIAHLDIKPLNFLIRENADTSYDVVLTDFGISQCYQNCLLGSKSASNPEITCFQDFVDALSSNELHLEKGTVFKIDWNHFSDLSKESLDFEF